MTGSGEPDAAGGAAATVHGFADPPFGGVADAFRRNFATRDEVGAAVCVYVDGRPVVDLWAGSADRERGIAWSEDTLALVFSTTKGITAGVVNLLLERGVLDVDAPVAQYWPEFAAAGKEHITLRQVLGHRAGLAAVDGDLTMDDVLGWSGVVDAIAAQAPNWEPGTAHGYHARSFGWILGEVVRRVTGRSLGRFFAEEIAQPAALDIHIGTVGADLARVARTYPPPEPDARTRAAIEAFMPPDSLIGRVLSGPSNLFAYDDRWNRPELLAAEMPSSNGTATARSVARYYATCVGEVDGFRLIGDDTLARACELQSTGPDLVTGMPMDFGLGWMVPAPGGAPSTFGHAGAGGSLGLADRQRGYAFGYVMNQMQLGLTADGRAESLVAATDSAIG